MTDLLLCSIMTHKEEEITEYQIPDGVSMIGENAFTSARIGTFVIPDSVAAIGKNAIDAYYYNKSYQQKNVTIKGYSGSCAETYAREHEIEFVRLGTTRQTGAPNVPAPLVLSLGDLNGDREINASDGAVILIGSAHTGAGGTSDLTEDQLTAGDINYDGVINASDAALVLIYAAGIGAGTETEDLELSLNPELLSTMGNNDPRMLLFTGGACAVLLLGCVCFWKSGAGRKKRTEEPSVF